MLVYNVSICVDVVRVRTARKKPGQVLPCIESLPSEYSYPESPPVSHENTCTMSEQSLERSLTVGLCYVWGSHASQARVA